MLTISGYSAPYGTIDSDAYRASDSAAKGTSQERESV
ncbi:hypothetical protein M2273_003798, partial [Mucilaginibacter lappiensis]